MSILSNTIKKLEEGCGKECINCKKEFIPRNSRELTCSKECSKKHRKLTLSLYIRKFKKSNANYWADYVALNSNKYRKYNNKWRKDNSVKMTKSRRKSYFKNEISNK